MGGMLVARQCHRLARAGLNERPWREPKADVHAPLCKRRRTMLQRLLLTFGLNFLMKRFGRGRRVGARRY